MRAKSKWTPEGILLWLIAAIVATLVVCSQTEPAAKPPASIDDVEIELEIVE